MNDRRADAPAARRIAAFAAASRSTPLPRDVIEAAKRHLLDAVGVGLAAAAMRERPRLERAVRALGSADEATGLGVAEGLPAPAAALLNGSLVHALEYDDTHMASVMHGSAVLAPVALALAEREDRSGAELLHAFALGWEVLARAGLAGPNAFQAQGFHGTPVAGAVAAALVAAELMRLDEGRTVAAMGIAGSQASGIFEFLADGSTVKMLHGGWPAFSGIMAAELAASGMTGPETVFEGRRGLFASFARRPEMAAAFHAALDDPGRHWLLPQTALKPWPCCHYIQAALECAEAVLAQGVRPAGIARVLVEVPPEVAWLVCEPWDAKRAPATGAIARHSLPYCVAALLVDGAVTPDTFDRGAPDPRLVGFAERIAWRPLPGSGFPERYPARLSVVTADGAERIAEVKDVRGSPRRPMPPAEIEAKFRANAGRVLAPDAVQAVIDEIGRMDETPSVRALSGALRGLR